MSLFLENIAAIRIALEASREDLSTLKNTLPDTAAGDLASIAANISTIRSDIAAIKAQNLEPLSGDYSFTFAADDTGAETAALGLTGLLKHLYLEVPSTTNNITITPSIRNAAGQTIWQGSALADNANYRLEKDDLNWIGDQVLVGSEVLVMTPSGAPGAGGAVVPAYARAYGVA